jgi:hypothetical protein
MYWSQVQTDDEYNTPKELWENIKEFLPGKDVVVWEAFYGNGKSGTILSDLGCTVIQSNVDFFWDNTKIIEKADMIVSNIPFSRKKEILTKLKEIDKPFIIIMPASTMFTQYLSETFKNELQIIVPKTRMHFEKDGVLMKRTSFDSCYYCYKMNLKKDIVWL